MEGHFGRISSQNDSAELSVWNLTIAKTILSNKYTK